MLTKILVPFKSLYIELYKLKFMDHTALAYVRNYGHRDTLSPDKVHCNWSLLGFRNCVTFTEVEGQNWD